MIVVVVAAGTAAVVTVLWWAGTRGLTGSELVTARFDALKVGLSIGVGAGGLFALYLAWRRQRSMEADLDNRERALAHQLQMATDTKAHQQRVADDTYEDARARRITELYTKAVEQLGSAKAPVRLGGLYALERLAQDNPQQRQTIVNVLCAYLRMPYQLPRTGQHRPIGVRRPFHNTDSARRRTSEPALVVTSAGAEAAIQEREVRVAAQRLLAHHLRPDKKSDSRFWPDLDLDLTGALLIDLDFSGCIIRTATFTTTTFTGTTCFRKTRFSGDAWFAKARFGEAWFDKAQFNGYAEFHKTQFSGNAHFNDALFKRAVGLDEVQFSGYADFTKAEFIGEPYFGETLFSGAAMFNEVLFNEVAFREAQFSGNANFTKAEFIGKTSFAGAQFSGRARFDGASFEQGVPETVARLLPPSDTEQETPAQPLGDSTA